MFLNSLNYIGAIRHGCLIEAPHAWMRVGADLQVISTCGEFLEHLHPEFMTWKADASVGRLSMLTFKARAGPRQGGASGQGLPAHDRPRKA